MERLHIYDLVTASSDTPSARRSRACRRRVNFRKTSEDQRRPFLRAASPHATLLTVWAVGRPRDDREVGLDRVLGHYRDRTHGGIASQSGIEPSNHPSDPAALNVRILHVEDNPVDVDLVPAESPPRRHRRRRTVVVAGSRECESMLDRERFDLVISGYNLQRGNGLEVLASVRKKNAEIPFILVSGSVGERPRSRP